MVSDKLMPVTLMKEITFYTYTVSRILARSLYLSSYMVGIRKRPCYSYIVEYRLPTGTLATAVYM